jgi:hypothetical protein
VDVHSRRVTRTRRGTFWRREPTTAAIVGVGVLSLVLLVLVGLPRFGAMTEPRHPGSVSYVTAGGRYLEGLTIDQREYVHLVEYYGGRTAPPDLAPFTRRIGLPWIAGMLPWDAPIAMNLVSLAALGAGLVALMVLLRRLSCRLGPILVVALVYSVSFPVFYWGTFSYVDGAVVGLLSVFLALLVDSKLGGAVAVMAAGLLVKESMLVAVPVACVWILLSDVPRRRRGGLIGAVLVVAAAALAVAQRLGPTASRFYNPWLPSVSEVLGYVGSNLSRVGPIGQVGLTAAAPIALTFFAARQHRLGRLMIDRRTYLTLWAGVASGVMLNVHAFLAAQWDGRTLWTVYPFALTLGAVAMGSDTPLERADAPVIRI